MGKYTQLSITDRRALAGYIGRHGVTIPKGGVKIQNIVDFIGIFHVFLLKTD